MILASGARGHEFDSLQDEEVIFHFSYVYTYVLLKSNILKYVISV